MSDPVTNVEVEDVLSSIRKLVSEDTRPVEADSTISRAQPECLVLQPSQRVDQTVKAAVPEPDAPEPILLSEAQRADRDPDISNIPGEARLAEFGPVQGPEPVQDQAEASDHHHDPRHDLSRLIQEEVAAAMAGETSHDDDHHDEDDDEPDWEEDAAENSEEDAPYWDAPEADTAEVSSLHRPH